MKREWAYSMYAGLPGAKPPNIDFIKVAENYSGIEIAPYFCEYRFDSRWYYGWDCASGCVWRADALKELKLLACFDNSKQEYVKV